MGAGEVEEWIQYSLKEPFGLGDRFADVQNALLCAVITNSIAGLKYSVVSALTRKRQKKPKPVHPKNFLLLPEESKAKKKRTGKEMLNIVEMLNEAFGGKDMRKKGKGK